MLPAAPPPPARLEAVLSVPRFRTYVLAVDGDPGRAAALYGWNARTSAALLLPMHFAEIAGRNIVHDALTEVYGPDWPWNPAYRGSLPRPQHGFQPRRELEHVAGPTKERPTGEVVAELRFVFWQTMFTARHHTRLWDHRLAGLLPHARVASGTVAEEELRRRVYDDLGVTRVLRNRVAHHEPIHTRPGLEDDLRRMLDLVDLRCAATGRWVRAMEDVSSLLDRRP